MDARDLRIIEPSLGLLSRPLIARLVVMAALAVTALASGCIKPVLSPDEDRTQFDRYDGIRAQYAPQYISDEFGIRRPNLRMRLGQKE